MLPVERKSTAAVSLLAALSLGPPPALALGETPTIPETFTIETDAGRPSDRFGSSVALGEGIAAIGAPRLADPFGPDGAVFLFDPMTGDEIASIRSSCATDSSLFGSEIAIAGQTLTISAPLEQQSETIAGAVYVYDITTQQLLHVLSPDSDEWIYRFGTKVAVNESVIAVSAYRTGGRTFQSGSVFLFDRVTGQQIAELQPEGGSDSDDFGASMSMTEDRLVVGAYTDDEQGGIAGAAYLFDLSDRSQIAKLIAIDSPSRFFGSSIAMDDQTIAVGNPFNNDNGPAVGAVHLYDASTGAPLRRIDPEQIAESIGFGFNVSVGSGLVFIASGLPEDTTRTVVRVVDIATGEQRASLLPDSVMPAQRFGAAIAARDSTVLIGAPYFQGSTPPGQAFVFSLACQGDTTSDGTVDLADLNLVLANFGLQTLDGDANSDGIVDLADLNIVLASFQTDCF